ncbi:unnamed protein product [Symbiodinium sp. CCMP2592]|nr:unnamed protein product [Symbiodinium sp. CCMP2592]
MAWVIRQPACQSRTFWRMTPQLVLRSSHRYCSGLGRGAGEKVRTAPAAPLVLDVVHYVPRFPVDEVLLTDLQHSDLVSPFGNWAMKQDTGEEPPVRADISQGLRLLVLLRVTVEKASGYKSSKKTFFVPFLVDTGCPQTFLCKADYEKLGIGNANNTYIEGSFAQPYESVGHFEDINLLGTDVLRKTNLFVDYQAGKLHLGFFEQGTTSTSSVFWVRELIRKDKQLTVDDGEEFEPTGNAFQVKGAFANLDDLKEGIKNKAELSIPSFKIDIYSQEDDRNWVKEETMSASLRDTTESDCYGFTLPQKTDDV